jgi:hypothetical protein
MESDPKFSIQRPPLEGKIKPEPASEFVPPIVPVHPEIFVELGTLYPHVEAQFNEAIKSFDPQATVLYVELLLSAHAIGVSNALPREYRIDSGVYAQRPTFFDPVIDTGKDKPRSEAELRPDIQGYFDRIDIVLDRLEPQLAQLIERLQSVSPEAELFANIRVAVQGGQPSTAPSRFPLAGATGRSRRRKGPVVITVQVCGKCEDECRYIKKKILDGRVLATKKECGGKCNCS